MDSKRIKIPLTIGELKKHLEGYPDHYELYFGGLDFYRLKQRGPERVQMEFNQQVYTDNDGKVVIENLD